MTVTPPATGLLRERLGIEVLEASADLVVARMPVEGNRQPAGLLAGGASCMLAESTASQAASLHAAGLGAVAVGVELNITHHRGVRDGDVTARAAALHRGRTRASYEVVVTDDLERRVATARVTCAILGLA
ncbi:PaaI family thioesterase [Nocardioides carbamazepini]|uniref:PaaI family thioesterase n=1 Tax=Nocardioides carbamazepini TaxID=2854259 RepID=UPI00214A832F|nr:PaaI family thioesterase [Nocardioides carbamazepini]MCR1785826.1 PaaI family thioesterase [Nocardioides carbamazepini]